MGWLFWRRSDAPPPPADARPAAPSGPTALVVGAGVIGLTTAHYLRANGLSVTVIEKNAVSADETSFQNGGILCPSLTRPWTAETNVVGKVLYSWFNPSYFMRVHTPALRDVDFWRWGRLFMFSNGEESVRRNTGHIAALALYSTNCYRSLIAGDAALGTGRPAIGSLQIFATAADIDLAMDRAGPIRDAGVAFSRLSREEVAAFEPVLEESGATNRIAGGLFSADDTTGDCRLFTRALQKRVEAEGVEVVFGETLLSVATDGKDRITGVVTDKGVRSADVYVLATASQTTPLVRKIGLNIPIYPVKGYSISAPIQPKYIGTLRSTVGDDAGHVYVAPMGTDMVRVSGFAEFAGYDRTLDQSRAQSLFAAAIKLLPQGFLDEKGAVFWTGCRPVSPDDVPFVGKTRYTNLYVNAGHGSKGWTLSCGSGKVLADIIVGVKPAIDPTPYSPDRFEKKK
eukprot:Opistho-2@77346